MVEFVGSTRGGRPAVRTALVQAAGLAVVLVAGAAWLGSMLAKPGGLTLGRSLLLVALLVVAAGISLCLRKASAARREPTPGAHRLVVDRDGIRVDPGATWSWAQLEAAWTTGGPSGTMLLVVRPVGAASDVVALDLGAERIDPAHVARAGALHGEARWTDAGGTA